jgi:hypothetical protein
VGGSVLARKRHHTSEAPCEPLKKKKKSTIVLRTDKKGRSKTEQIHSRNIPGLEQQPAEERTGEGSDIAVALIKSSAVKCQQDEEEKARWRGSRQLGGQDEESVHKLAERANRKGISALDEQDCCRISVSQALSQ